MIGLIIRVDEGTVPSFVLGIERQLQNRRGLHAAMASRLSDDLQKHFRLKNAVPNRMAAPKTNFWNQVAAATGVTEVTDTGATVAVAEPRFNLQLFGKRDLRPVNAPYLTIPLIPAARGKYVRDYIRDTGHRLFKIIGHHALFEKEGKGVRPVYAIKESVDIDPDPTIVHVYIMV